MASSNDDHERMRVTVDEGGGNERTDGNAAARTIDIEDPSDLDASRYRLLVPVLDETEIEEIERIMRTAAMIARNRDGDLLILCLVDVPLQTPHETMTAEHPFIEEARERRSDCFASLRTPASRPGVSCASLTRKHRRSSISLVGTTAKVYS